MKIRLKIELDNGSFEMTTDNERKVPSAIIVSGAIPTMLLDRSSYCLEQIKSICKEK